MGACLPVPVRQALIDYAVACNETVLALKTADVELQRAHAARDALTSSHSVVSWQRRNVDDRARAAAAYTDRLTIALARVAAPYAVYASHVASATLAGSEPDLPHETAVLPSQVIADAGRLLPPIALPARHQEWVEQNADISTTRDALDAAIAITQRSGAASHFDEPTSTQAHTAVDLTTSQLAATLLEYATAVTWAIGEYTRAVNPENVD